MNPSGVRELLWGCGQMSSLAERMTAASPTSLNFKFVENSFDKKKKQNCIWHSFEKNPQCNFLSVLKKNDFLFSSINLSMCSHPLKRHINWPFGTLSQLTSPDQLVSHRCVQQVQVHSQVVAERHDGRFFLLSLLFPFVMATQNLTKQVGAKQGALNASLQSGLREETSIAGC